MNWSSSGVWGVVEETVSDAADRLDQGVVGVVVDLAADALDIDIDEVGARVVVVVPDVFAELGPVEDPARRAHEAGEEGELPAGEGDVLGAAADLAGEEVDREIGCREEAGVVAGAAPEDGVETGDELVGVEGLRQVVIGAEVQAFDAFVEGGAGGEEEDGDRAAELADLAEDAEAIATGEHDVQDQGIEGAGGGEGEGVVAIVADVHDEARGLERLADEGGDLPLVFSHEHFHGGRLAWPGGGGEAVNHDKTVMRERGKDSWGSDGMGP